MSRHSRPGLAPVDAAIVTAGYPDPYFRNISGYSSDIYFEGASVYFGYQLNVAYEINDKLSVAVGGRYVTAKNTYSGYIQGVTIGAPAAYGGSQTPGTYLRLIASQIAALNPAGAAQLNGTATYLDDATTIEADAEMTGSGFAPILSLNFTPSDKLNISLKYEFKTNLELKTTVKDGKDAEGMFIQDSVAIAGMPAMFAAGVNFKPIDRLMLSGSFMYYFDKNFDYDGQEDVDENRIDKNFLEAGLGVEYGLTEKLRASAGWVATFTGVNDLYNSEMTYSTNTNSFGAGFGYRINPMIDINLGGSYTFYKEGKEDYLHNLANSGVMVPASTIYNKKTWIVALGVDLNF